jgi:hypothetical protein
VKNKIKNFKKRWLKSKKTYENICFVLLTISTTILTNRMLEWVSSRDFITIYPALKIIIFLGITLIISVFSYQKIRFLIKKYPIITNFLLVVSTIVFTFSVYFIDEQRVFYNTNTFLVHVNNINIKIAKDIMEENSYLINFVTKPYEENIPFIAKNFVSDKCVANYYSAMLQMRITNQMNDKVRESFPWTKTNNIQEFLKNYQFYKRDINHSVSTTLNLLEKINKECHR